MNKQIIFWLSLTTAIFYLPIANAQRVEWPLVLEHGGYLIYGTDEMGNRIPDFSYAGYKYGTVPLPTNDNLPSSKIRKVSPTPCTKESSPNPRLVCPDAQNIQAALNDTSIKVVELQSGRFQIDQTLIINRPVVLRGQGKGGDKRRDTILTSRIPGPDTSVITIDDSRNTGGWRMLEPQIYSSSNGPTTSVVKPIRVGDLVLHVADTSDLPVNAEIAIVQECNAPFLRAIGGDFIKHKTTDNWKCGKGKDVIFYRTIKAVNNNRITLDAPVYTNMALRFGGFNARVGIWKAEDAKKTDNVLIDNVGIESLRIDIQLPIDSPDFDVSRTDFDACHDYEKLHEIGNDDLKALCQNTNHARNAIEMTDVIDSWIRDVHTQHFSHAGISIKHSMRVTVRDSVANYMVGRYRSGGQGYNFTVGGYAQLILFKKNSAEWGRHNYVVNGGFNSSGIVFTNNKSKAANAASESHKEWIQGLLFDRHIEQAPSWPPNSKVILGLYNRGSNPFGPHRHSHGWAATHSVIWNASMPAKNEKYVVRVQSLPDSRSNSLDPHNYLIGARNAEVSTTIDTETTVDGDFPGAPGWVFSDRGFTTPTSLYEAQLRRRTNTTGAPQTIALTVELPIEKEEFTYVKAQIDKAVSLGTIKLDGKSYERGIGAHSRSKIRYHLNRQYTTFLTDVGLDDQRDGKDQNGNPICGSVTFSVFVDGKLRAQTPTMVNTSKTVRLVVDVSNANYLELVVGDGDGKSCGDHGDWANPRLIRAENDGCGNPRCEVTTANDSALIRWFGTCDAKDIYLRRYRGGSTIGHTVRNADQYTWNDHQQNDFYDASWYLSGQKKTAVCE